MFALPTFLREQGEVDKRLDQLLRGRGRTGPAAVLAGLVFVGVSINLDKIVSNPDYGLTGRLTVD
jgi:hypothetical protein